MAMITNDWLTALGGEFHKPYYRQLFEFVKNEYDTTVVFPPADDIFNAFHLTPLSKVKVVIIGQDPYHNVGQAHGLCFSVKPDVEIPPSLVNIYQELHDDLGCYIPNNGYLVKWAEQGVLMLNTVLTVRAHMANSHHGKGWEEFTDAAIRALNAQDRPIVFMPVGQTGTDEEDYVEQSQSPDFRGTSSQPVVCLPRFLWQQTFQQDQQLPEGTRRGAHRLAD